VHCRAAAVGLVVAVLDDLAVGAAGSPEAVVDGPVVADGDGKSGIQSAIVHQSTGIAEFKRPSRISRVRSLIGRV